MSTEQITRRKYSYGTRYSRGASFQLAVPRPPSRHAPLARKAPRAYLGRIGLLHPSKRSRQSLRAESERSRLALESNPAIRPDQIKAGRATLCTSALPVINGVDQRKYPDVQLSDAGRSARFRAPHP